MKIIDAHLHIFPDSDSAPAACQADTLESLRQLYAPLGIVHGVVMGNRSLALEYHNYPPDLLHYCVGLDGRMLPGGGAPPDLTAQVEAHLRRKNCCGIKLYPGYNRISLSAPMYQPIYELAQFYQKPVAVHMGLTVFAKAHLKYCHPLALDQAAADHPGVRFVMCHFGNPFLESAAAVLVKNPNVSADLSGLLEDPVDLDTWFREQAGYAFLLRTWLAATGCWDRLLYGSDWPIISPEKYISFIQRLVPPEHWEAVFYENAARIYGL
nr:amidohydrolase family protein [uncultured Oscillibacter sp.]